MVIGLAKTLLCFFLCICIAHAYQVREDSYKRTSKFQVTPKPYDYKLRHSRYPRFGKVIPRIENFSGNMAVEQISKDQGHYKLRHKGWNSYYRTTTTTTTTTEAPLFDTLIYGDFESKDDFDDYDNILDDEDEYEDEATEDNFFDTIDDDNFQAEQPTEKTTAIPPKPVSSLTEYKWNYFGTMSRVEQSRNRHLNLRQSPELSAVLEHYTRMNQQTKCHKPLPRVISVQKEHPDPSKIYTPHCTVLHRCAEDSGCCNRDTKCQYKSRVLVQLYFYTNTLGSTQSKVEKLEFYNHTECECKEKSNFTSAEIDRDHITDLTFRPAGPFNNNPPQTVKRCKCPSHFQTSRFNYKCSCDCEGGNEDCIQLKKGKEHFSMIDRICIQDEECGLPICEYGTYIMNEGKCPSKKEKMEEYRKVQLKFR